MKVYILFSLANEYNQPNRAFEQLFWNRPGYKDLEGYGFTPMMSLTERWIGIGHTEYWIEEFTNHSND